VDQNPVICISVCMSRFGLARGACGGESYHMAKGNNSHRKEVKKPKKEKPKPAPGGR
jgi:hypothetical protein